MFDKTMLLDGDIFLYMVTTQCEEEIKWEELVVKIEKLN